MKKNPRISLDVISVSLFDQHIAQAIDELQKALALPETGTHEDYLIEWRLSSSCIVHSVSALDSLVNGIGFDYFFNKDTDHFIPDKSRGFSLKRMIKAWDNLSLLERLMVVAEVTDIDSLQPKIENEIRELNDLRNWIIHGKPFILMTLREYYRDEENYFRADVHDWEESVDWKKKYPNTKFKSPSRLDRHDAKNALRISVKAILFILEQIKWFRTSLTTFYGGVKEYRIDSQTTFRDFMKNYSLD